MQARIQSNLNRRGSGKKRGGSRIKKTNFGLIFGNFHVILTNFLKKRGVPTPGTLPGSASVMRISTTQKYVEWRASLSF
jgi:hypothetical protein